MEKGVEAMGNQLRSVLEGGQKTKKTSGPEKKTKNNASQKEGQEPQKCGLQDNQAGGRCRPPREGELCVISGA